MSVSPFSSEDIKWMRRAFAEAVKAQGHTSPNPMVGCAIVKKNKLIALAHHQGAGQPHAEILALQQAGTAAAGSTVYVTLEPCAHHGRTGSCVLALISAKIARVVIAMQDPNPKVNGKGIHALQAAGITVALGPLEQQCKQLNEAFCYAIVHEKVWMVAKIAQSLDGRNRNMQGQSQWITHKKARIYGHTLRARLDAIMVGQGTVSQDNPQLTCRYQQGRDPIRIVLDSRAQTSPHSAVVQAAHSSSAPTWICVTEQAATERLTPLRDAGANIIVCPMDAQGKICLQTLSRILFLRGICSVLVEGGSSLLGNLLANQLLHRLHLLMAPCLIAGTGENVSILGPSTPSLAQTPQLVAVRFRKLGKDYLLNGRIRYAPDPEVFHA
jgi:diaminohydroxyphosphoribosylaminopyrimidine deaminase/5-amino-6-(5-phosphoribosylamino)uracil reductase